MISFVIKYSVNGSDMIDASVYAHDKGYIAKAGTLVFRKEEFKAYIDMLEESAKYRVIVEEQPHKATVIASGTTGELFEDPFGVHEEETWQ